MHMGGLVGENVKKAWAKLCQAQRSAKHNHPVSYQLPVACDGEFWDRLSLNLTEMSYVCMYFGRLWDCPYY